MFLFCMIIYFTIYEKCKEKGNNMEKIWEAGIKGGIQELHLCWEMGKGDLLYIPGLYQFVVYIKLMVPLRGWG